MISLGGAYAELAARVELHELRLSSHATLDAELLVPFFARGSAAALRTLELGASTGTGALVRAIAKSPKAALLEHLSLDAQELSAAELALYDQLRAQLVGLELEPELV